MISNIFSPMHSFVMNTFDDALENRYDEIKAEKYWMFGGLLGCMGMFSVSAVLLIIVVAHKEFIVSCESYMYIPNIFYLRIYALKRFLTNGNEPSLTFTLCR